ncbi:Translin [Cryomyces antarcticus]
MAVSPFLSMFETFRAELDEHHDRRERVIKASRDITAASKKIIFSLQRARALKQTIPQGIQKANKQYYEIISAQYNAVSKDLQGLDAYRYSGQITGGNQEFMEAASFQYYLERQSLISLEESRAKLHGFIGESGSLMLTLDDYLLGIFDMTGELMRFAITAMATNGELPGKESRNKPFPNSADDMDVDAIEMPAATLPQRNVLADLRQLRSCLEGLDVGGNGRLARDMEKKTEVMRVCVEKVERALYGLIIRGRERPKGWIPMDEGGRQEVESH